MLILLQYFLFKTKAKSEKQKEKKRKKERKKTKEKLKSNRKKFEDQMDRIKHDWGKIMHSKDR